MKKSKLGINWEIGKLTKKVGQSDNFTWIHQKSKTSIDSKEQENHLKYLEDEAKQNPAEVDAFEEAFCPKREVEPDCE